MTMRGDYTNRGGQEIEKGERKDLSGRPMPLPDRLLQLELTLVRPLKEILLL